MNGKHYNPQKLVEWRDEFGKTQVKVAEIIGVERNTISRAETGKVASYELLATLCKIYGKSIHDLTYSNPVTTAI